MLSGLIRRGWIGTLIERITGGLPVAIGVGVALEERQPCDKVVPRGDLAAELLPA